MERSHVVFDKSAAIIIQTWESDAHVLAVTDNLSCGPLGDMMTDAAIAERVYWWTHTLGEPDPRDIAETWRQFRKWNRILRPTDTVVLWVADSPAEQIGCLCVVAHLPHTVPVSVVRVTEAYAQAYSTAQDPQLFDRTSELLITKWAPLLNHAVPVAADTRNQAIARWHQLVETHSQLRVGRNGGQIESVEVDYFDPCVIEQAQVMLTRQSPIPAVQLVQECLGRYPQIASDALVFWRIRCLIKSGTFTYTGILNNMRNCSIRLPEESL